MFKKTALIVVKLEYFSVIIALVLLFAYLYQKAIFFMKGTGLHSSLSMVHRNGAIFSFALTSIIPGGNIP
ncbi:MAG: hypothetical protein ACC651_07815 [Candidatus Scalindua sp.]